MATSQMSELINSTTVHSVNCCQEVSFQSQNILLENTPRYDAITGNAVTIDLITKKPRKMLSWSQEELPFSVLNHASLHRNKTPHSYRSSHEEVIYNSLKTPRRGYKYKLWSSVKPTLLEIELHVWLSKLLSLVGGGFALLHGALVAGNSGLWIFFFSLVLIRKKTCDSCSWESQKREFHVE